eukprot:1161232-Pelagomonas_calceolata.AAC.9
MNGLLQEPCQKAFCLGEGVLARVGLKPEIKHRLCNRAVLNRLMAPANCMANPHSCRPCSSTSALVAFRAF